MMQDEKKPTREQTIEWARRRIAELRAQGNRFAEQDALGIEMLLELLLDAEGERDDYASTVSEMD